MQTSRQVVRRQRKRDRVRGAIRRDASSSLEGGQRDPGAGAYNLG